MTTRDEGAYNTNYRFTGKLFDKSAGLYYYGARYYDPELGRFISPDTIVPYPDDPQSLNRYAYARNNPIRYLDPTGHSWWDSFKKWIGHIVGAIAGVFVGAISGNFWLGFQVYTFWSGAINSAISGNWGAFAGGMAGSIVGGVFGLEAATWGGTLLTGEAANSFLGGFITGAIEFGAAGFGAGFGAALGGGASFGDAMTSGLISGGISALGGGILQGSYMAGWQDIGHGASRGEQLLKRIELAKEVKEWSGVYNFLKALPPAAQKSWALYHSEAMLNIRSDRWIGKQLFKSYRNMLYGNDLIPPDFMNAQYNDAYVKAVTKWTFADNYLFEGKKDVWDTTVSNWILNPRGYEGTIKDIWINALKTAY